MKIKSNDGPYQPPSGNSSLARLVRESGLDCGSVDTNSIPGVPSPCVGSLLARKLVISSNVPGLCRGRLGHVKEPYLPMTWMPDTRSKLGNRTTVASLCIVGISLNRTLSHNKPNQATALIYKHIKDLAGSIRLNLLWYQRSRVPLMDHLVNCPSVCSLWPYLFDYTNI